jgi:hypothetical protein
MRRVAAERCPEHHAEKAGNGFRRDAQYVLEIDLMGSKRILSPFIPAQAGI